LYHLAGLTTVGPAHQGRRGFASPIAYGLFHFYLLHGAWMSRLRIPGASALSIASLLTLWAVAIAIWKPQPIHILELHQIEGPSQLVQALKGLEPKEAAPSLRHLQKHLQQINPNMSIHRMKVRVTQQNADRPNREGSRAILAVEADGRLDPQRLEMALRGWNADSAPSPQNDSIDPLADKLKRWSSWKHDIARHQLMLLSASVDRPQIRKIASAASLASYPTSDSSSDSTDSIPSPELQWRQLLEETSTQVPDAAPSAPNLPYSTNQEALVCRSASWHPVAGPVRFDRLLAATATPLFLWAAYRWLVQLSKWRANRSRAPWTQSLQAMGLLSFGRLECAEETNDRPSTSSRNWNLGGTASWWLEATCFAFPLALLIKAILNPPWGRFFFSEPIAALPKLLEWW
jgi:hypothetical protein